VPVLIDTSILVRIANTLDPLGPVARNAVRALRSGGERMCVAPQNLIEFRNAATRPRAVNGLGFDVATVERQVADFELTFALLEESPAIYPAWKSLVHSAGVIGNRFTTRGWLRSAT
jgi:predicted nucleic acid-binding protein